MKNLTTKLTIAAAVMAVAAGAAAAQTMKADVPFAFRTASGTFEAGTYTVSVDNNQRMVLLEGTGRTKGAWVMPLAALTADKQSAAKLVFSCGADRCTLVQVWSGPNGAAYQFARPKTDRDDEASLVAIAVHR
jgi:hypothetical protein